MTVSNPSTDPTSMKAPEIRTTHRSPSKWWRAALAVCSGILLFLSYPSFDFYLLAWIAFIPLLFAIEDADPLQAYGLGVIAGMTAAAGGFYWFANLATIAMAITFPWNFIAMAGHSFFVAQLFGLVTFLVQWLRRGAIPGGLWWLPALWVSVLSAYPSIFRFTLGDSQAGLTVAVQGVDLIGVLGLDFVILLVNVWGYRLLQPSTGVKRSARLIVGVVIVVVWFGYGIVTLARWDARIAGWESKRIGLVQPNRPPSLVMPVPEAGYSRRFPLDMALTEQLVDDRPDLVVWPEGFFYGYTHWSEVRKAFADQIRRLGFPLIFFDATRQMDGGRTRHYNSAIWLEADGTMKDQYHKMKLVPFGETLPLVGRFPWLRALLGDFLAELSPGTEHKTFAVAGMRLVPKICYEPLFPSLVAEAVGPNPKGAVVLVQSQNGWYGESSQPFQHLAVTVLRAVENRVPLIHVINNGPSAVILPSGRIAFQSEAFQQGAWVAEMPYHPDSGGSFLTRFPELFMNLVRLACLVILAWRLKAVIYPRFEKLTS
jgi:apolipoprotein N-acyltransferase